MDNIPIRDERQNKSVIVSTVERGDIIRSPNFANLLFKDLIDLDAFCGFDINPMRIVPDAVGKKFLVPEQDPEIVKKFVLKDVKPPNNIKKLYKDIGIVIDAQREFVVLYTFRNTKYQKEYFTEDDTQGHYPLGVIMKMLAPDRTWDDDGIEVWFNMESWAARHAVAEVECTGFIAFNNTTTF